MSKDKRKSNRHFNLEKPVVRHFDIEKEKVPIVETKVPHQPIISGNQDGASNQGSNDGSKSVPSNKKGGKTKWIAAASIAGLLALWGGGYYLSHQGKTGASVGTELASNSEKTIEMEAAPNNEDNQSPEEDTSLGVAMRDSENPPIEENNPPKESENTADPSVIDKSSSKEDSSYEDSSSSNSKEPQAPTIPSTNPNKTIEEEALDVIRGTFGNNPERRRLLGDRYVEIQKKVNEMYKNGLY